MIDLLSVRIALGDLKKARLLSRALEGSGYYKVNMNRIIERCSVVTRSFLSNIVVRFQVLSDIHRPKSASRGIADVVGEGVQAISLGRKPYTEDDAEFYSE